MVRADSVAGALLGGAIGDALGAPFEGRRPDAARALPERGRITDDTELTLATCEALVESGRLDLGAIAARYVAWYEAGRLHGLGAGTTKALRDLAGGAHWALAGVRGEYAAGAGAAMRVAPVAFLLDVECEGDRTTLRDFARMTHHHEEAYAGAVAVAAAVRGMLEPKTPQEVLRQVVELTPDSVVRDRLAALSTRPAGHLADALDVTGTTGYVADVVPLALFGALRLFDAGLARLLSDVVRLGGDTDTIGATLGTVVGARLGRGSLPDELLAGLIEADEILPTINSFSEFAAGAA